MGLQMLLERSPCSNEMHVRYAGRESSVAMVRIHPVGDVLVQDLVMTAPTPIADGRVDQGGPTLKVWKLD